MTHAVLDLFAGSGWGVACKTLGAVEYGVEIMPAARETRRINSMPTPYENVWDAGLSDEIDFDTLIASPPCQTFSMAGAGAGRKALDDVLLTVKSKKYRDIGILKSWAEELGDDRIGLVLSPLHYAYRHMPMYAAFEQVPAVLPVWEACAVEMRQMGYSVWVGYISSELYGVAQTRKRAYLIARRDGKVARPPMPTNGRRGDSVRPPVSISQILQPRGTHISHGTRDASSVRSIHEPAATMAFGNDFGSFRWTMRDEHSSNYDAVKASKEYLTEAEAAAIQSYPDGFVFGGNKAERVKQIGNAVPPLVAKAVLEELWD